MYRSTIALSKPKRMLKGGIFDISKTKPSIVSKWESEYGNIPIENMQVCRVPLNSAIEKLANALTLGKYNATKKEKSYDHYYHLYLVFQLQGGKSFNIEKNERVQISTNVNKKNETCVRVPYKNGSLTFKDIIRNAEDTTSSERLWYYNALGAESGPGGNCQDFINDLLSGSNLITPELRGFIKQSVGEAIKKDSAAHKLINFATNLKNRMNTFFHGGSLACNCGGRLCERSKPSVASASKRRVLLKGGGERIDLIIKVIKELIEMARGGSAQSHSHVQAILFHKPFYTENRANSWLIQHKFRKIKPLHSTENYFRARIVKPSKNFMYRTKKIAPNIKMVLAYPTTL